jgi:hypothetical protein
MIHFRIVVPSYQSEHVLDLLDGVDSVTNLIFLERAARRPQGDVILCDVARDDASVIVSDLKELEVHIEGSIALEQIDSQISVAADAAESAEWSGRRSRPAPRRTPSSRASSSPSWCSPA